MQPAAAPAIRTENHPQCYLCGKTGVSLYEDRIDALFAAPGRWNLKRCQDAACGLIWLDPRPLTADLNLVYQAYFTHGPTDAPQPQGAKLRAWLYSGYLAAQSLIGAVTGLNRSKLERRKMFLTDCPPGLLLDVGCGDGLFLSQMQRDGWRVDGVDFDGKAIAHAKAKHGLTLRQGDLTGAKFPDQQFDAVTLSHVIEHIPDPIALLTEIHRILKPGGRMVLTTPNTASYGHERFQPYWFGLDPPRHLHLFSPQTLRTMASRAGFEILRADSTAASADIFLGGSMTISEINNQPERKPTGANIRLARGIRAAIAQHREHFALKRNPGLGEEAVLIAKRTIN